MIFSRQPDLMSPTTTPVAPPSTSSSSPFNFTKLIAPNLRLLPSLFIRAPLQRQSKSADTSTPSNPNTNIGNKNESTVEKLLLENPLTTLELQRVLIRRLTNFNLPDDFHTHLSESLTTFITTTTSLFAKLYLLNLPSVDKFLQLHPSLVFVILSQLYPLRILQIPLMKIIRPLQWILAPFSTFATPLTLKITIQKGLNILFPRFFSSDNKTRRGSSGKRTRTKSRSLSRNSLNGIENRPTIVNDVVNAVHDFSERTLDKFHRATDRAKAQMHGLPPIPRYQQPTENYHLNDSRSRLTSSPTKYVEDDIQKFTATPVDRERISSSTQIQSQGVEANEHGQIFSRLGTKPLTSIEQEKEEKSGCVAFLDGKND